MSTYNGLFDNWNDVKDEFETEQTEPANVLLADYQVEGKFGTALVVYQRYKTISEVTGAFVTPTGITGQWEPRDYSVKDYVQVLKNRIAEFTGSEKAEDKLQRQRAMQILKKIT